MFYSKRVFSHTGFAKPEVDMAYVASREAEWLATLRLDKTNDVIFSMEASIDTILQRLADLDKIAPPDEETRKSRDEWLAVVKVYLKSYPFAGDDAATVNSLLRNVPDRSAAEPYNSDVYRLDDQRLARLNSVTNAQK